MESEVITWKQFLPMTRLMDIVVRLDVIEDNVEINDILRARLYLNYERKRERREIERKKGGRVNET